MLISNEVIGSLPAFIGGSGLYALSGCGDSTTLTVPTPYRGTAVNLLHYRGATHSFLFLPRHGRGHHLAPHQINYRANLWALKQTGAACIVAFNAVGGIDEDLPAGTLCLPDQLIDYTWGRTSSFHEPGEARSLAVLHPDFTQPYSTDLREEVMRSANELGLPLVTAGVYGCTQGPRLETAAEIRRLQRDGCSMVGMTGMPEAILARELGIPYCSIALVVNRAAGLAGETLDLAELEQCLRDGVSQLEVLARALLPRLTGFATTTAARA